MAKNTKTVSTVKANGKAGKAKKQNGRKAPPKGREDAQGRFYAFTKRFNEGKAAKAPIKIEGSQGSGKGMSYSVSLPGLAEPCGITRAIAVLASAGYSRAEIRQVCDAAGQPEIRDSVIQSYSSRGLTLSPAEEKAAKGKGLKAAHAYYAKRIESAKPIR